MAVSESTIKAQIVSLINDTKIMEQEQAAEAFASGLSSIIKEAILSATVVVAAGIPVATSGGAGATSAPGSGTLS